MITFKMSKEEQSKCQCSCSSCNTEANTGCSCGDACTGTNETTNNISVLALGGCCKKSQQSFFNAIEACINMKIQPPTQISDMGTIASYGVMSTPALVINNKVVSTGKLLTVAQIEALLAKALG